MASSSTRAVLYLRISLDREMDGLAIDRQREACEKIARDRGWEVVDVYIDQSKSATDKTKKRPDYDRMVADFRTGKFDAIVCWDLDRLTRQPRQLEDWIDAAEDRGLHLVTANGEADLTTDGGRMYARIKAAVARGEVDRKSARQSAAHIQRAKQGRAPKGTRPLGYATNGDVIEHEAEAVRKLYAYFAIKDGVSIAALAAGLSGKSAEHIPRSIPVLPAHRRTIMIERNERRRADGLPAKPVPENKPWTSSTVLGILRNPRYAGYSVYTNRMDRTESNKRRTWTAQILRDENNEPVMGQWSPIVTEEVWWAVQRRLDEPARITNRTGSTARKHVGSGLYLCGICDETVKAHSQRYRCASDEPYPHSLMRSRSQVDAWVLTVVRARLARPDLADTLPTRDEPRLKRIDAQIDLHKGKIARAQYDYDNEIIEGFDLKRVREREKTFITALETERDKLVIGSDLGPVLRSSDPVMAFDAADLMIKRRIVDFFCTVRLHPHPRGKKNFDPATVEITPKALAHV
ncbi:DNA invertase Pin-like site-specific DNA recombinase [Promicromonospora sp. AC04]|uniref:recombinase family protein n=1 Tax=Promicromonospora sp. AC04 TaxID=2135723 RepID=UPI000D3B609C|nr:recombinase family protein [Promicromonospora sp. AC04]PUB29634.1 DNA invertase Pin-like site-specific DNA recombinase [Promicromonospora sp. AC04]